MSVLSPRHRAFVASLMSLDQHMHALNRDFEVQTGITLTQWNALDRLVSHPAASATELSRLLNIHTSTLTPLLRRLIAKRLVFETADPRDSRKKILAVTRAGKTLRDRSEEQLNAALHSFARSEAWSNLPRSL